MVAVERLKGVRILGEEWSSTTTNLSNFWIYQGIRRPIN
jgi:hypothetical protein